MNFLPLMSQKQQSTILAFSQDLKYLQNSVTYNMKSPSTDWRQRMLNEINITEEEEEKSIYDLFF